MNDIILDQQEPRILELVLPRNRDEGQIVKMSQGFTGKIAVFEKQNAYPSKTCAKFPIVRSAIAKAESAHRFLRELQIQRGFYHHQFVHWPYDFDFLHQTPVAWFRFWHHDLSQLIEDEQFSELGRLAMIAYLAEGLRHCHDRGMKAHQDLKPENIFVQDLAQDFVGLPEIDVFKIPKTADFGSVNLAQDLGIYRGTRPYMAPEQWNEEPLGEHTTVWSLGLIAYELLSKGIHPLGERTAPWRSQINPHFNKWQKDRIWKRWLNDGLPVKTNLNNEEIHNFILRCLSPLINERPTLRELCESFLGFIRTHHGEDAYIQVEFRISEAATKGKNDYDWPHLDSRLDFLGQQINREFGLAV